MRVVLVYPFKYRIIPELTMHLLEANHADLSLQHQAYMSTLVFQYVVVGSRLGRLQKYGTFNFTF